MRYPVICHGSLGQVGCGETLVDWLRFMLPFEHLSVPHSKTDTFLMTDCSAV